MFRHNNNQVIETWIKLVCLYSESDASRCLGALFILTTIKKHTAYLIEAQKKRARSFLSNTEITFNYVLQQDNIRLRYKVIYEIYLNMSLAVL